MVQRINKINPVVAITAIDSHPITGEGDPREQFKAGDRIVVRGMIHVVSLSYLQTHRCLLIPDYEVLTHQQVLRLV